MIPTLECTGTPTTFRLTRGEAEVGEAQAWRGAKLEQVRSPLRHVRNRPRVGESWGKGGGGGVHYSHHQFKVVTRFMSPSTFLRLRQMSLVFVGKLLRGNQRILATGRRREESGQAGGCVGGRGREEHGNWDGPRVSEFCVLRFFSLLLCTIPCKRPNTRSLQEYLKAGQQKFFRIDK